MTSTTDQQDADNDEVCPHCGAALDLQQALAQERSVLTRPMKASPEASKSPR